jgi:hypothetical protein
MTNSHPRVWDWAREEQARPLRDYFLAPDKIGFYELGYMNNSNFEALCWSGQGHQSKTTSRATL